MIRISKCERNDFVYWDWQYRSVPDKLTSPRGELLYVIAGFVQFPSIRGYSYIHNHASSTFLVFYALLCSAKRDTNTTAYEVSG